jgi:hypothetical protein
VSLLMTKSTTINPGERKRTKGSRVDIRPKIKISQIGSAR